MLYKLSTTHGEWNNTELPAFLYSMCEVFFIMVVNEDRLTAAQESGMYIAGKKRMKKEESDGEIS